MSDKVFYIFKKIKDIMSITIHADKELPKGYIAYQCDYHTYQKRICRKYAYPYYKTIKMLTTLKYKIYRLLNKIGIMKTPQGCYMQITDILRR